jgi:uncharacterized protein (TIGR02996 family)
VTDADFLKAVIAAPDDDTPRLAFADWLDDRGDAGRAEFIRFQIREAVGGLTWQERDRMFAMLREHGEAWKVPFLPGAQTFDRGFVGGLSLSAEEYVRHAETIHASLPLTRLRLVVADPFAEALANIAPLRRVPSLDLSNSFFGPRNRLAALLGLQPWPGLRQLRLRNNSFWPEGIAQFVQRAGQLPALRELDFSGNPLGDEGIRQLAESPALAELRVLILRRDEIQYSDAVHAAGGHRLAESRTLTQLTHLDLSGQPLGDAGLAAIVRSPNARRLEELDVFDCEIGLGGIGAGVEAMVESSYLGRLKRLDLARNRLESPAVEALLTWPRLANFEWLDLRRCEITENDLSKLRGSRYAEKMKLDGIDLR